MKNIDLLKKMNDIEIKYIKKALNSTNNNIARACKILGMKRTTLYMRMIALKIVNKNIKEQNKKAISDQVVIKSHKYLVNHKNSVEDQL